MLSAMYDISQLARTATGSRSDSSSVFSFPCFHPLPVRFTIYKLTFLLKSLVFIHVSYLTVEPRHLPEKAYPRETI